MFNPEEEVSSCFDLYGSPQSGGFGEISRLANRISGTDRSHGRGPQEFRDWAFFPRDSVVPVLKLVWMQWFYIPLAGVNSGDVKFSTWRYSPIKIDDQEHDIEILDSG